MVEHDYSQQNAGNALTTRETEIMLLAARGMTDKRIAQLLQLRVSTVKNHLHSVFLKLRLSRRAEPAAFVWAGNGQTDDQGRSI
ncbi:MAG: response regulator transcription factor [Longimicrobiales bacterium]